MTEQVIIDKDPADDGDLAGTLKAIFRKELLDVEGMLPAEVVSYNRKTNMAVIRPLIAVLTTGGAVPRAQLANIPVLAIGGGGFVINFPLQQGDKGWIEASDRDISLYMQQGQSSQPNSKRLHSFSDGRFIPDVMAAYTIDPADEGAAMVIQSLDGQTKISLAPGVVTMKSTLIKLQGDVEHVGKMTHTGATVQTGMTTNTGGMSVDGIPFGSHKHTGVTTGPGTSGGPTT